MSMNIRSISWIMQAYWSPSMTRNKEHMLGLSIVLKSPFSVCRIYQIKFFTDCHTRPVLSLCHSKNCRIRAAHTRGTLMFLHHLRHHVNCKFRTLFNHRFDICSKKWVLGMIDELDDNHITNRRRRRCAVPQILDHGSRGESCVLGIAIGVVFLK